MTTQQQKFEPMSPRYTKQILERCTPREILVMVAAYGAEQIAKRMGYADIEKFLQERSGLAGGVHE